MHFFVIVTFPAVHMSCQAMSPVSPLWRPFPCWVDLFKIPPSEHSFWDDMQNNLLMNLHGLPIHFSLFNCGFWCLLAPPVHLPFIMQLFWAWSQILCSYSSHITATHTHYPYLVGDTLGWIFQETKLQHVEEVCGCLKGPSMNWIEDEGKQLKTWVEQNPLLGGTARTKPSDCIYRQRGKHIWFMFVACQTYTICPFYANHPELIYICILSQTGIIRLRFADIFPGHVFAETRLHKVRVNALKEDT